MGVSRFRHKAVRGESPEGVAGLVAHESCIHIGVDHGLSEPPACARKRMRSSPIYL
jgi:hypothetical protein